MTDERTTSGTVRIGERPLTVDDVVALAGGAAVELGGRSRADRGGARRGGRRRRRTDAGLRPEHRSRGPATLDIPSLDPGVEDHVTAAPLTVQRTDDALTCVDEILAVELLAARDVIRRAGLDGTVRSGTASMVAMLDVVLGSLLTGTATAEVLASVTALSRSDDLPAHGVA